MNLALKIYLEGGTNMKSTGYADPRVVCPFYKREESNKIRKIHCEGFCEGVHIHIYFDNKEVKKDHKKNMCKSNYKECPIYKAVDYSIREEDVDD